MRHACGGHAESPVLDVREVAPRIRHPKIFETFDALRPGHGFILVNDHDPRPLLYQFQFERAGAFGWRYLEQGPEVWRVEITRRLPVTPDRKVEDVSRDPRALAVLKDMGINHCCGAPLTLSEAAAAAGVPVDKLVAALNQSTGGPA
jgi:regulator of cell morphogenesis and NO signaling